MPAAAPADSGSTGAGRRAPRRTHGADGASAQPAPAAPVALPAISEPVAGPKTKEQKRQEAEARNRAYRATRGVKGRFEEVEGELTRAQSRHEELVALMAQPELYADQSAFDSALAEYTALRTRIPVLEEEWMKLTEELERLAVDGE